jgi:pimeloyl-ACP methyl ester carboxylesterase
LAPWIKLLGGMKLIRRKIRNLLLASSGDSSWVTDDVVDGYTAGASRNLNGTLRAYLAMAGSREPEPLAPHLAEIRCPVVLLAGGVPHPGGVGVAETALLARSLRAFLLDSVIGAGHFIYEEQPAVVAAAVVQLRTTMGPPRARRSP